MNNPEYKHPETSSERGRPTRRQLIALGLAAVATVTGVIVASNPADQPPNPTPSSESITESAEFSKEPVWRQEFAATPNQTTPDKTIWRYETNPEVPGYNDEAQAYTQRTENVRIEPGVGLVIEAHKQPIERPYVYPGDELHREFEYTSGRIDTQPSLSFEYGKVEATMKLPKGDGVWPAFWILSGNEVHTADKDFSEAEVQDETFYKRNGEIDIMEYYGNIPNQVEATVHTFGLGEKGYANTIEADDLTDAFHTYGVEITPESIIWTFDGEPYHRFDKASNNPEDWPFGDNNQLYLIFNLAMGGEPFDSVSGTDGPWRLEVADVKFYEYTGK